VIDWWVFFVLDYCHIKTDLNDDAKIHVLKHINGMFVVKSFPICFYLTFKKWLNDRYLPVYKFFKRKMPTVVKKIVIAVRKINCEEMKWSK